ncbi:MAG: UDP-N-acetylglucosamine 2-epimerase (non-hydrolyzing) [Planctomycetes bacterium]|nr:UDP-N-acetylglucosamine 2-epimerase (non-hydrolyzing) [Planctomycetota bacterium]
MKIVTIIGARPQFIKAAVVSRAIRQQGKLTEILVHTGQHYDENMSDVFFSELGIPAPVHHLGVGSGGHAAQTGRMLLALDELLPSLAPQLVLIYGDTNSTLAGALAAAKLNIPVAHVEAGLRSFNRRMPEEVNRVLADHVSDLLFAPTDGAVENLRREGIAGPHVRQVGDVMYDATLVFGSEARNRPILADLGVREKEYVLATVHRAENTDDPARLTAIFTALAKVAHNVPVIVPLHPRTRQALARHSIHHAPRDASPHTEREEYYQGVRFVDPLGYLDMMALQCGARLIVTDSGGVQKEAYFHRVPCLTLRGETEWTELVDLGFNRLADPTTSADVEAAISVALESRPDWSVGANLYGNGTAAETIAAELAQQGERGA